MLKKYKQAYGRGLNYFEKSSVGAALKGSSPFLCSDFCLSRKKIRPPKKSPKALKSVSSCGLRTKKRITFAWYTKVIP